MKVPIGITRGLAAVALVGLMVLAVLGFRAQEKDMESLRDSLPKAAQVLGVSPSTLYRKRADWTD